MRAPDGVGVLYRIARAFDGAGLDVRTAKVLTLGHEVVDTFYVRDAGGAKVSDLEQRAVVERAVLDALAPLARRLRRLRPRIAGASLGTRPP